MKKFHISQLFLKFHMVSFPVSMKIFYLKDQWENGHVKKENKTQEISHLWNFTWVLFSGTIDRDGQAMSFEDTKKVKRDGVVRRKEKREGKGVHC